MFYKSQPAFQREKYEKFLKMVGGLSNLFSDSEIPYLYYRAAENIFCEAFDADNLSRADVSADAKKDKLGLGLKTFLAGNKKTFQKVAEFNASRGMYQGLSPKDKAVKIAQLRNERIDFTERSNKIKKSFYHCVIRDKKKFIIFEEPMDRIDINSISSIKESKAALRFNDGLNDYSFLMSKSTLTKRFEIKKTLHEFDVKILKNPLEFLEKHFSKENAFGAEKKIQGTIYLPLYSPSGRDFEKSGLNQWNAGGRSRDINEAYIPIPAFIHSKMPEFFPKRNVKFSLVLPDGDVLSAKVCQDRGKALMSDPNKDLGKWILRDVLNLKQGEVLTRKRLNILGIDSVRIDKIKKNLFEINFSRIGRYEEFAMNYNK